MGCNVRLMRVLGEGSNGVAALFDIYDESRGARRKFVIKGAIPPATLTNEKAVHDVMFKNLKCGRDLGGVHHRETGQVANFVAVV